MLEWSRSRIVNLLGAVSCMHCGTDLFTAPAAEGGDLGSELGEIQLGRDAGQGPLCLASTHPIAFISNRAGRAEWQLYAMMPDGGEPRSLKRGHFRGPTWSPDARSIAFRYYNLIDYETSFSTGLGITAADGSGRVTLLVEASGEAASLGPYRSLDGPSWSPDGETLAFASQRGSDDGSFRAWTISRWGGEPKLLLAGFPEAHAFPSFSPRDMGRVAIVTRGGVADVWSVDVSDPTHGTNLTRGRVTNPESPRWSPDGGRLAFSAERAVGVTSSREIYVLTLASDEIEQLTSDDTADVQAAWSPDGNSLLVSSERARPGIDGRLGGEALGLWVVPLEAPGDSHTLTARAGGYGMGDWAWNTTCAAER
jgi:Tol biopolymer transport system component